MAIYRRSVLPAEGALGEPLAQLVEEADGAGEADGGLVVLGDQQARRELQRGR